MPGTTSRHALPYPVGTDTGGQGDVAIKSLAEAIDAKLDITTFPDAIAKRAKNLCLYSEAVLNGAGYIIIQTNIPGNSSTMSLLNITGMVYAPDNNVINLSIFFYPFEGDSSIVNSRVANMGSFPVNVQMLHRTSDSKVAIALSVVSGFWEYPKLVVDGIFGHRELTTTQLTTGWSISRVANLTGYTVKATPLAPRPAAEDTGWVMPPLLSGHNQYDAPNWGCEYRRKGGIVYIRGLISPSTSNPTGSIFNLPVGFRPYKNTLRGVIDAGSTMRHLYIDPAGNVYVNSAPHPAWLSLENVTFPAGA